MFLGMWYLHNSTCFWETKKNSSCPQVIDISTIPEGWVEREESQFSTPRRGDKSLRLKILHWYKAEAATGEKAGNTLLGQVYENSTPEAQDQKIHLKITLDQDSRAPSSPNMNSNQQ